MNTDELSYLRLADHILQNGDSRQDRTGIGTKSIFGAQLRFSLKGNTLPLLTTKRMFTRGVIEELFFFLRGETDTKKLEAKGVNIWKGNTSREFLDNRGLSDYREGNMGPMYGSQWRNFNGQGIDQIQNVLDLIKNDPNSRRMMVTAYNPAVSHLSVLEPCHMFFQFYVNNGQLSCQWYQRAVDYGLGFGFNLTSYSVLTHLIAKATNLEAKEIIFVGGDVHIYKNHISQIKEQITREPFAFPKIKILKNIASIQDIEKLQFEDFEITEYQYHPPIKMEMAI